MANSVPTNDRTRWLQVLQIAAESQPDTIDDHWRWLMHELGLPLVHFHEVLIAVAEGRWRKAQNPRAYVKTVARRLAQKQWAKAAAIDRAVVPLGDKPCDREKFSFEEAADLLCLRNSAEPSKHTDGIWRRGDGNYEDEPYDDEGNRLNDLTYRERMLGQVPKRLTKLVPQLQELHADRTNPLLTDSHIPLIPRVEVRWESWAKEAGLDIWEYEVLQCKLSQITRDQALANQPNEEGRKAIQAAWRRFDRTGLRKLREATKINSLKNVPKRLISDTSR